jgi:hypothetical protein
MTLIRRHPRGVFVAILASIAAVVSFGAPPAQAFYVKYHETITRNALPADQVSQLAINQILVGPPPGGGAMGSDAFATDEFRHLDNSINPVDICNRAQQAWDTFSPVILSGSVLNGAAEVDGPGARAAFGALLHTQQDFYAHSNWVEENIAIGQLDRLAPPIFPVCNPADFPADLHTGYYSIDFAQQFPLEGCPAGGPPPGFQECHSALNKDGPHTPRGATRVPGTNLTDYDVAAQLATRASTDLYFVVRDWVANANGQDAAVQLFQQGGPMPSLSDIPNVPNLPNIPNLPYTGS